MKTVWFALLSTNLAVVLLFTGTLVIALEHRTVNDQANVSVMPVAGKDAVVDYERVNESISQTVSEKMESIPSAAPEPVDYSKVESIVQNTVKEEVAKLPKPVDGKDGTNGSNGTTILKLEFRQNLLTHLIEWRCVDDTMWASLKDSPVLRDSCP